VTIKLDARAVTRAALRAFQEKDLTNPTPREYLLVGAVVHALCEALAAATAEPAHTELEPLKGAPCPDCGVATTCRSITYEKHLTQCPRLARVRASRAVERAAEAQALDAMRLREPGEHVGVEIRSGCLPAEDSYSSETALVEAHQKAGRRSVAAVVHHYEALIGRALYYLADASTGDLHARTRAREALRGEL
jgi:hypothetical protein